MNGSPPHTHQALASYGGSTPTVCEGGLGAAFGDVKGSNKQSGWRWHGGVPLEKRQVDLGELASKKRRRPAGAAVGPMAAYSFSLPTCLLISDLWMWGITPPPAMVACRGCVRGVAGWRDVCAVALASAGCGVCWKRQPPDAHAATQLVAGSPRLAKHAP